MSGFSKRLKKYERHILLGLVILLLVSFSVMGAVQCAGPQGKVRDLSGTFQASPRETVTIPSDEFARTWSRYQPFVWTNRAPSLRWRGFIQRLGTERIDPQAMVWAHVLASRAAEDAGYRCGEKYQLPVAIREAISPQMSNLAYNDALYERFLRDYYRRPASEFQQTISEVVEKDMFLAPLIETTRYSIPYEEAYEAWKRRTENVDLEFVAVRGRDFALAARQVENSRSVIQQQLDRLLEVDRTLRNLERIGERIRRWKETHEGKPPVSLEELGVTATSLEDAWRHALVYTVEGDEAVVLSVGPDGESGTGDDVTADTVAEMRSLEALRRVADALEGWREKTGSWPESLDRLLEAPKPDALAPLARAVKDGHGRALVYVAPSASAEEGDGAAAPSLRTAGADGEAGNADDLVALFDGKDAFSVAPGPRLEGVLVADLRDAWEHPLRTRLADATTRIWDVRSAGADGAFDTDDDLRTGNASALRAFYERPVVQSDYRLPMTRRFRALYVQLPLVPDEVMARLWEAFPQYRPDEKLAYDTWRKHAGDEGLYRGDDPADPETGHGADLAARLAPDKKATLVPSKDLFGEAPADLIPKDDPDHKTYLENGWREVMLREAFFEALLADQLRTARDRQLAHAKWEKAKAGDSEKPGEAPSEEPGEEPVLVTFEGLLAGILAPFLPGEADPPYLGFFETEKAETRAEIEAEPNLGGYALTSVGFQGLSEPGQFAEIPTQLNDRQTKAILQNIELNAARQPDLEDVRDEVFERYLAKRSLDLAADRLDVLRQDLVDTMKNDPEAWSQGIEAWGKQSDIPYSVLKTGWFIGPRPPREREIPETLPATEALAIGQKDFVRQTGYEVVRPSGEAAKDGTPVGALGREILKDEATDGTGSAYLVRVADRSEPPAASFSPRDYRQYVIYELLGDILSRQRGRRAKGAPRGRLTRALYFAYEDIDHLKKVFGLRTKTKFGQKAASP